MSRLPAYAILPALLCIGAVACGGGGDKRSPSSPSPQPPTSSPPPTYSVQQIKSSLLGPRDVAAGMARQSPTYPGLKQGRAPSCSDSTVTLPAKPDVIIQQIEKVGSRYEGGHYIQLIAVYGDSASAAAAFTAVQKHAAKCPAKRHFPAKRLPGNLVTYSHDDTWKLTQDSAASWTHIRGFQKRVIPPSASVINVFYVTYDYAYRGNVMFSSVYWERVKPKVSDDRIAKRATNLLNKQLQHLG